MSQDRLWNFVTAAPDPARPDILLGQLALELRLITPDQLNDVLKEQEQGRAKGERVYLGQILLRRRILDTTGLTNLLTEQRRRMEVAPLPARYEIRDKVGEGGVSAVYRGWDKELNRPVAVKVLRDKAVVSELVRARFQREAGVVTALSHPNIVSVYAVGGEDSRPYLILEFVEGETLREVLGARRRDLVELVRILEKVARGVAAAHEKNVLHRDLTPANVLVTRAGEPKVADFGLTHIIDATGDLTKTAAVIGTPMYLAPEQVLGKAKEITAKTDVYALGALLYEILTGAPPHIGMSVPSILASIVNEDPVPPRRVNPRVPAALEAVALRALERDPQQRYASASEFAEELRRFREGEPVHARTPGIGAAISRSLRRRPALTVVIGVLLALGLGSVISLAWRAADRVRRAGEAEAAESKGDWAAAAALWSQLEEKARASIAQARRAEADEAQRRAGLVERGRAAERERDAAEPLQRARLDALVQALYSAAGDKAALAEFQWRLLLEAERDGDDLRAAALEAAITESGVKSVVDKLEKGGTLHLDAEGAEVFILRCDDAGDGRLVAKPYSITFREVRDGEPTGDANRVGRSPIRLTLPVGAYILILKAKSEEHADLRVPVRVGRETHVSLAVNVFPKKGAMVYIPPGPFVRGGDGTKRTVVDLPGYYILRREVTMGEYVEFLNHLLKTEGREAAQARVPRAGAKVTVGDTVPLAAEDESKPVTGISWNDADEFCRYVSARDKMQYRLPTSDEWEKAARGADGRRFPWGDGFDWSWANGGESDESPTVLEVGSKAIDVSPYGIFDMGGNVSEWCGDWTDGRRRFRVIKGGNWTSCDSTLFRAANRQFAEPADVSKGVGFRVVRVSP